MPKPIGYHYVRTARVTLRISNTLSGEKEHFAPLADPVRIYVCGMTPKNHPHIGHARLFVTADMVRRVLEYRGFHVHQVQNFTDIDDKIIARARLEGITPEQAAKNYTDSYFESMDQLSVRPADAYPTVTGSMPQIIEYIEGLIDRGFAYAVDGDVYFEVARFPAYGKLSGRTEESGMEGVRVELEPGKRDPRDFALWKRAKPGEPSWESPWGPGRPGWHIECSTMVRETLGDQIDIHLGGQDLLFPHHENEIAQSESFTGCVPFAKYWLHLGLVMTETQKMAHSLDNFTTLKLMLERYEPAGIRLYLLQVHYRAPMVFSEEALGAAARSVGTLRAACELVPDESPGESEKASTLLQRFRGFLDDDFNTPGALSVAFDAAHLVNRTRAAGPEGAALRAALIEMIDVLGIPLRRETHTASTIAATPFIDLLVQLRSTLRSERNFALADKLRDDLKELGITIEDTPSGPVWRADRP